MVYCWLLLVAVGILSLPVFHAKYLAQKAGQPLVKIFFQHVLHSLGYRGVEKYKPNFVRIYKGWDGLSVTCEIKFP